MRQHSRLSSLRLVKLAVVILCLAFVTVFYLTKGTRHVDASIGDSVPQSVQKGVDFLTPDVVNWTKANSCVACHRQGGALNALSNARANGYTVNTSKSDGIGYVAQKVAEDQEADGRWSHFGVLYPNSKTSYAFFGMAGYDKYVSTEYSATLVKAANWAINNQVLSGNGGYWFEDHGLFPTTDGNIPATARMMVGIAQAKQRVDSATAALYQQHLDRGANWIRDNQFTYEARNTFHQAYALIGLKAAGVPNTDPDVVALRDRLLGETSSRTGRGWGYDARYDADEFNTGIVLYALGLTGVRPAENAQVNDAINWLRDRQVDDPSTGGGLWRSNGFNVADIPTTFAILGLSSFGELGVELSVEGPDRHVIRSNVQQSQTVTYNLKIANRGAFDVTDTYNLSVQGGLPGWTTAVDPYVLTLPSGQSAPVTLTVTAPPGLPEALPVEMTVIATSQANPKISASVKVTTYTDPPPPTTGDTTETTFTIGANGIVASRDVVYPLAVQVRDTVNNRIVSGPNKGVVTFYVAGVAVGTDREADGDGVFRLDWIPGDAWNATGTQDLRAVYSGIDLPAPQTDLLPSFAASTVNISLPANQPPTVNAGGPYTVAEGSTIVLTATGNNPGGGPLSYAWDTDNDGTFETPGPNAVFSALTRNGPGIYPVKVQATNGSGQKATAQTFVNVENIAPFIALPPNQSAIEGSYASFNLGWFSDPGPDSPWTVDVDWGDGSSRTTFNLQSAGAIGQKLHLYAQSGVYNATVSVRDRDGASETMTLRVQVLNVPPAVNPGPEQAADAGVSKTFDLGSFRDPGPDAPWVVDVDWGDGSPHTTFNLLLAVGENMLTPQAHTYNTNGVFTVTVKVIDKDGGVGSGTFSTTVSDVAVVRHAPVLNSGRVEGTLYQLTGENVSLGGGDTITNSLKVPGTPILTLNGNPTFGGIIEGSGNTQPTGYQVRLGGTAALGQLSTRTNPVQMPFVPLPPASTGTRDVTLNKAGQNPGSFVTIRDLSVLGTAGMVTIAPGTYRALTASGNGNGFILGTAGASSPVVYNLNSLTLNGNSRVKIAGPVLLNLAQGLTSNGPINSAAGANWLRINIAQGALKLDGGAVLYAAVLNPSGPINLMGQSRLVGGIFCDQLSVSGASVLSLRKGSSDTGATDGNRPPSVSAGPDQTIALPTLTSNLSGSVSDDGLPAGGGIKTTWSEVSGPGAVTFADASALATTVTFSGPGAYVLRLTASDSQLSAGDDLVVSIGASNQAPTVNAGPDQSLVWPANTATLSGAAMDDGLPSGQPLTVSWSKVSGPGAVVFASPNQPSTPVTFSDPGVYILQLTASDSNLTAFDDVAVSFNAANQPPTVNAGPDRTISLPTNSVNLQGVVADDGLPAGGRLTSLWTKISGPGTVLFGNAAQAATAATFSQAGTYLLRLTASDTQLTNTDDVTITVTPANQAPSVEAGPDQTITLPKTANLNGMVSDDGLPIGSKLAINWTSVSGPGNVSFSDPHVAAPIASFSAPGNYLLRLTASDSEFTVNDDIRITVNPPNQAPHVDAGPDQTITLPDTAQLNGTVTDDGLPSGGALVINWTGISGPGTVTFSNPNQVSTRASFGVAGTYVLRLSANDSELTSSKDVTIQVNPAPIVNQPPSVNAGADQNITLPAVANLTGAVSDDGLPAGGSITVTWSKESGPGNVNFGSPDRVTSTAGFSVAGTYVLRLTASDSLLTNSDTLTVTVNPALNQPPTVNAGPDQVVTLPGMATLHGTAMDDGIPAGSALSVAWSQVSGPGNAVFGNSQALDSTVTFSTVGYYLLRLTVSDSQLSASDEVLVKVFDAGATIPGGVFLTGHDPDYHAGYTGQAAYSNALGAKHIIQRAISYVTYDKASPRILLITDVRDPGSSDALDSRLGLQAAGFSFDVADYGSGQQGALDLHTINFGNYDALVIASDFGGWLRQDELDILNARRAQLVDYLNRGGGLVAFAESGAHLALTSHDRYGFLPFLVSHAALEHVEEGNTLTPAGLSLGLTGADINGNAYHNVFNSTGGMEIVDLNASGQILSLMTRGKQFTLEGLNNDAPIVSAGPDRTLASKELSAALSGVASDDGRPEGSVLSVSWSKVEGPGTVTFTNAGLAATSATFSEPGRYVLRLTASDSQLLTSDEMVVTVNGNSNQPPSVSAGPDQTITLPSAATLNGTVTDDGLPSGSTLSISWTKISGPGSVHFGNPASASTTASFDEAGTYVLRLTAGDGLLTSTDEATIEVKPAEPVPVVSIASPSDESEVTTRAGVIGSVSGGTWKLEYSLTGDEGTPTQWTTLSGGSGPMSGATLGVFDPTLLLNGRYLIRLSAANAAGQMAQASVSVIVNSEQKVGNFSLTFTDLSIPVSGLPIEVTRTYDSRDKRQGDFGIGWTLGIHNVRLQESRAMGSKWLGNVSAGFVPTYCIAPAKPHVVTITLGDGKTYRFEAVAEPNDGCQLGAPFQEVNISFRPLPGTLGSLAAVNAEPVIVPGPFPGAFDLLDGNTVAPVDYDQYQLTLENGTVLLIDQHAGLQRMTDTNGNTLTITSDGIIHSSGKSVSFTRDAQGRITQITDPAGHSMSYTYDANGDLVKFNDCENNLTQFTYNSAHGLLTILDPRGLQPLRNEYDAAGRLIKQTDAFGNVVTFTHDLDAQRDIARDRLGNITIYEYDARGNVVLVTDAKGGTTARTYDDRDNLLTETNALGKTVTYTYDAHDNRLTETDALGSTIRYTYNSRNQVLTITDAGGGLTTNTYDADGNLLSTRDPLGNITTATYTASGLLDTTKDALGNITSFVHDGFGNLIEQTDPLGHKSAYTYDANGNLLTETVRRTNSEGVSETLAKTNLYDSLNRLIKVTHTDGTTTETIYNSIGKQSVSIDQMGRRTSYEYDSMGQLISTIFPDGKKEENKYDAEGRLIKSIDREGRATLYGYDALGQSEKITYPDNSSKTTIHNSVGQVLSVTDGLGNTTRYEYDAAGRRTKITDALAHVTTFAYNARGLEASMTDAKGQSTQYEYDAAGHRTRTVYPDGTSISNAYDSLGRNVSRTDQAGKTTQFTYDWRGKLIKVTDALGGMTSYTYDETGNQLTQTDANGRTTTYAYDVAGRRTGRKLPLGMSESFAYDAAGNLSSRTDFRGKTTTYTYDSMGQLTSKLPDASLGQSPVVFTYTASGERLSMTDGTGKTSYTYDSRDRLLSKATPYGTLDYTYDADDHVLSVRSSNANGLSVDYNYDALGHLSRVIDNHFSAGTTEYAYDANGNLASVAYPNGVETSYAYNSLNRLTNLSTTKSGATLAGYAYTLGPTGNRLSVTEAGGRQVNYSYDALYRLTGETMSGGSGGGPNGTINYTYDAVGNRLQRNSSVAGLTNRTYTYDANDRLTTDVYDANGNTAGSNGSAYAYDFEDHLTSINGGAVLIAYDGDGNRVSKTAGGVTTRYLVDDNSPTGRAQVAEEIVGGVVQRAYTYGHNLISQNQLIGGAWTVSFYGYDGHGSVRFLTNGAGAVTDAYTYDAFGNLLAVSGTTPNDYLYGGEQLDSNIGLYYLRARYLNPASGRFWTADSYEGLIHDPASLHKYLYANGDPVNKIDPSGNQATTVAELDFTTALMEAIGRIPLPSLTTVVTRAAIGILAGAGFEAIEQVRLASRGHLAEMTRERERVKEEVETRALQYRAKGRILFHYTKSEEDAMSIVDEGRIYSSDPAGPFPEGVYATNQAGWLAEQIMTRSQLAGLIFGRNTPDNYARLTFFVPFLEKPKYQFEKVVPFIYMYPKTAEIIPLGYYRTLLGEH